MNKWLKIFVLTFFSGLILNLLGILSKGAKATALLDDANDAVKGGSLGDEAAELLKGMGDNVVGETRGAGILDELDGKITQSIDRV